MAGRQATQALIVARGRPGCRRRCFLRSVA